MVVVGAWSRNDSRMGGLQERTSSNLDKHVLVAAMTSPVAISNSGHLLRRFGRAFLDDCLRDYLTPDVDAKGV
jgi:hypothetical protein